MAGNAGNWFKPTQGYLKGRAFYLSKAQRAEIATAGGFSLGDRAAMERVLNEQTASREERYAMGMAANYRDRERPTATAQRRALVTPAPDATYTPGGPVPGRRVPAQAKPDALVAGELARIAASAQPWDMGIGKPRGNPLLAEMFDRQGFAGKPTKVSRAAMDALVADGHEELFRGVNGGNEGFEQGHAFISSFMDGDYYAGSGIYGQGTYTASAGPGGADRYGAQAVAAVYVARGAAVRMALRKDAKVADYEVIEKEREAWSKRERRKVLAARKAGTLTPKEVNARIENIENIASDAGYYATMMGYDAFRVPAGYDSGPREYTPAQVVVLNRTAVIVEATVYDADGILNS